MRINQLIFGWLIQVNYHGSIIGDHVSSHETKSQITTLLHSDPTSQNKELYSGHGYKDFALRVWTYQ